jgi:putative hydrolase
VNLGAIASRAELKPSIVSVCDSWRRCCSHSRMIPAAATKTMMTRYATRRSTPVFEPLTNPQPHLPDGPRITPRPRREPSAPQHPVAEGNRTVSGFAPVRRDQLPQRWIPHRWRGSPNQAGVEIKTRNRRLNRNVTHEPFGDIPLFREIQRLLSSSSGPVNYEIARQVASATAAQSGPDRTPAPDRTRVLFDSVYRAQEVLSGFTRLTLDEPLRASAVTRGWWIESSFSSWRWLLEQLAGRFADEMGRIGGSESEDANPIQAAIGQIAPLLMGIQAGTLVGSLAPKVLSRYDLPIPRDDDGALFVVEPNVHRLADDYRVTYEAVVSWIAMQDVARALALTATAWIARYYRSLIAELVDSIELDTAAFERRLMDLQTESIESLQSGIGADGGLPIVSSARHSAARERLRAFIALLGGYAQHACRQVAPQVAPEAEKIDEIMARRAATPSEAEALLSTLLGLSFDRTLEGAGTTFCAAVASLKGIHALNRVWEAPDNLPDMDEIRDPFLWMERLGLSG